MSYKSSVTIQCNLHKLVVFKKRILLGVSMDGQVAIKQMLGMFSAKVRDSDSNAEKVRASDKHPSEWLSHHGWTKRRHMTWRRPKRGTVIQPLEGRTKDDRRRAAHALRESWRMAEWEKLTNQTSRHQTVELQNCHRARTPGSCWGGHVPLGISI